MGEGLSNLGSLYVCVHVCVCLLAEKWAGGREMMSGVENRIRNILETKIFPLH